MAAHGGGTAWRPRKRLLVKGYRLILLYIRLETSQGVTTSFPHFEESSWQKRVFFSPKTALPQVSGEAGAQAVFGGSWKQLLHCAPAAAAGASRAAVADAKKRQRKQYVQARGCAGPTPSAGHGRACSGRERWELPSAALAHGSACTRGLARGCFLGWVTEETAPA